MGLKERIEALQVYKQLIEGRVASPVPEKHIGHPETYRAYLANELRVVTAQIESLKVIA